MRLLAPILLSLVMFPALAAVQGEGFLVTTTLHYKSASKKEISVSKEMILPVGIGHWTPLTEMKDRVVLLGRIAQTDESSIKVEYMLIDGHQKPSSVVSTPSILARLNEAAEISITDPGQKSAISISLIAKKTLFTSDGIPASDSVVK